MALYNGTAPEDIRYFDELGDAMRERLPVSADADNELVASFHQIGLSVGGGFEWQALDEPTRRGIARAIKTGAQVVDSKWASAGQTVNGWKYTFAGGRAGYDPGLRAALVKYELGAQLSDQVLYPNTSVDDKGEPLSGANKYVLHFDAGKLPPVSVFWNMAMYGSDMLFVENESRRYSIGSFARHRHPEGQAVRYVELASSASGRFQSDHAPLRPWNGGARRLVPIAAGEADGLVGKSASVASQSHNVRPFLRLLGPARPATNSGGLLRRSASGFGSEIVFWKSKSGLH